MEVRIELVALVRLGEEVLAAEGVAAVLALDREEVYEHARRRGALGADGEEPGVAFGGGRARHSDEVKVLVVVVVAKVKEARPGATD